jgi:hypothetical protein
MVAEIGTPLAILDYERYSRDSFAGQTSNGYVSLEFGRKGKWPATAVVKSFEVIAEKRSGEGCE